MRERSNRLISHKDAIESFVYKRLVGVNHIPKIKYIWYINLGNKKNTSSLKLWL